MNTRSKAANGAQPRNAIIYARVSTGPQEEDGTSLDSQVDACVKLAEAQGYTVGRITREVYTGAELWDRPKLAQDRADIKAGQFQALIVYAIDRLTRDPIHLAIVADECERAGAELIFVTEPLDTSPEAALIRYVKGYAAKMEREKIRERTLRGKRMRALQGKVHNSGVELYGYRRDKEAGMRRIYEPEAAVVRNIFRWIGEEGASIKTVIHRLTEQGVPPPAAGKIKYPDPTRVPRWGNGQVARILRNPTYKGDSVAWRWKSGTRPRMSSMRPEDEWIRLPAEVAPAIVNPELWQAVQDRLVANRGEYTRNLNKARQYLLRGRIQCAVCGMRMYPDPDRGKCAYRCSSRRKACGKCGASQVPARLVETWVWEKIAALLRDPSIITAEVQRRREEGPDPVLTGDLETAQRRLAKIDKQQARLLKRYSEADDDDDTFPWELVEREISSLEREKTHLQATIADLERRLAEQQHTIEQLDALNAYCERVRRNLDTFGFEEKRLAIEALGVRVIANGRDWQLTGEIPMEVPETGILSLTS